MAIEVKPRIRILNQEEIVRTCMNCPYSIKVHLVGKRVVIIPSMYCLNCKLYFVNQERFKYPFYY